MQLETPVVLIIYRRPDLTQKVFEVIARAKPQQLFVIADGPKMLSEIEKCEQSRAIAQKVDWECDVLTNFSETNMGLKKRVSSGLDWVFSQVEEAIILEDDCLPSLSFFHFCQTLLRKYRDDERIFLISGNNFQFNHTRTPYSYYFSRYTHIWGWATWKRTWEWFDIDMSTWPEFKYSGLVQGVLENSCEQDYWVDIFERTSNGLIDSWAYILQYTCWMKNGLNILPNSNLVSNLGFRKDAIHTTDPNSLVANLPVSNIWNIQHPPFIIRHQEADSFTFENIFGGNKMNSSVDSIDESSKELRRRVMDAQQQIDVLTHNCQRYEIEIDHLRQFQKLHHKLEELYAQNQILQERFSKAIIKRNDVQSSLKRSRQIIKREKRRSQRIQTEMERTKQQLQESLDTITAMQSSKFWRLRSKWVRFKALFSRNISEINSNSSTAQSPADPSTVEKTDSSESNIRQQKNKRKRHNKQQKRRKQQAVLNDTTSNQEKLLIEQQPSIRFEQAIGPLQATQDPSPNVQVEPSSDLISQTSAPISSNPEEILLQFLQEFPRYTPTNINFFGTELSIVDSASFLSMYQEIFKNQIYKFEAENQSPRIIDGGANIGLTLIYFKQLYPGSHIISFEPDEQVFNALKINVEHFGFSNVELVNKALWNSETVLEFMAEGADAGRLVELDSEQKISEVPTTRLRDYLQQPVDFLKIDIEGAETEVLEDCRDLLGNVKNAFVEFHSFADRPQTLHIVTDILASAGFRLHVQPVNVSPQPFCHRGTYMGMDLQLNIFAFRN